MKKFFISFLAGILVAGIIISQDVSAHATEIPNIQEPSGLTVEEVEALLKHNLKGYGKAFLNAEEDYQIDCRFLIAVSALESGWGRYRFKENNIFGFGSIDFDSIEHCIDYVAWFLRKHYINESGRYYRGGTIEAIGSIYCPDGGIWAEKINQIYRGLCK